MGHLDGFSVGCDRESRKEKNGVDHKSTVWFCVTPTNPHCGSGFIDPQTHGVLIVTLIYNNRVMFIQWQDLKVLVLTP